MKRILELAKGHKLFREFYFEQRKQTFEKLVREGQHPKILFISCCDSRVVPSLITAAEPGDLFEMRNIGNFVPPYSPDNDFHATATAIEFAVNALQVSDIVVCGHSHCGACAHLFKDIPAELVHTRKWLELGKRARDTAIMAVPDASQMADRLRVTEQVSVVFQLENLLSYPYVKNRLQAGSLFIHGWYFDLEAGQLHYFEPEEEAFKPVEEWLDKHTSASA